MLRYLLIPMMLTPLLRADFTAPAIATHGWDRPTALNSFSTFQAWETFSSLAGPNAPQTVTGFGTGDATNVTYAPPATNFTAFGGPAGNTCIPVNAAGTANAYDTGVASFLTSGGNIYSPTGLVAPRITVPNNLDATAGTNPNGTTTVLLQLRLLGSEYDPLTMRIDDSVGGTPLAPVSSSLLASQSLGGFGGTLRDYAVRFEIPGNADQYTINFTAAGSSMSLDRIAVDTFWAPVPEPMLGLAALALIAFRYQSKEKS